MRHKLRKFYHCENIKNGSDSEIKKSLDQYQSGRRRFSNKILEKGKPKMEKVVDDKDTTQLWCHTAKDNLVFFDKIGPGLASIPEMIRRIWFSLTR